MTVSSGATLEFADAIVSSGATFKAGSGSLVTVSGARVFAGADLTTLSASVLAGGTLEVLSGGAASATTVSSGGRVTVAGGGTASGGTVLAGGVLSGAGTLAGVLSDQGVVDAASVGTGAELNVLAGGVASAVKVGPGGEFAILAGGIASAATLAAGGTLIDNGSLVYAGATSFTLAGNLSGGGLLAEDGSGRLVLSGAATGFSGTAVISGGVIELADADGLGSAAVMFSGTKSVTLQLDAAAEPASGAKFADALVNFHATNDRLDVAGQSFVSGAKATVSGGVLTLQDGSYTAQFTLQGTVASKYVVGKDSTGGTIIHALAGSSPMAIIQAAAAFHAGAAGATSRDTASVIPGHPGLTTPHGATHRHL